MVVGVLFRSIPPREYPTGLFTGLWPHSFHVLIQHLSFIYYNVMLACDATIARHKRNTNIQELHTLPNTLLIARTY